VRHAELPAFQIENDHVTVVICSAPLLGIRSMGFDEMTPVGRNDFAEQTFTIRRHIAQGITARAGP
jgi:hypothetical protein